MTSVLSGHFYVGKLETLLLSFAGTFDEVLFVDDTAPASHGLALEGAATQAMATATTSDTSTVTQPASGLAAQHSVPPPTQHVQSAHTLTMDSAAPSQLSAEAASASASDSVVLPSTVAASVQRQSTPSVLQGHSADVTPQQAISNAQHQPEPSLVHNVAQSQTLGFVNITTPIKADTSALHDYTAVEADEASSVSTASSIPEELDEAIEFVISQESSTGSKEVPQPGGPALPTAFVLEPGKSASDLPLESVLQPGAAAKGLLSETPQPEASAGAQPLKERSGVGASSSALLAEPMPQSAAPVSTLLTDSGHLLAAAPASHLTEAVQDQDAANAQQHHASALLALAEAALADADADAPDATEQGINASTCFVKVC